MTTKDAFSEQEWTTVLEGPTSAAMAVILSSKGGSFRETFAEAKFFAEARQHHGSSELLDAIVAHKPKTDHTHAHSKEDVVAAAEQHLRDAATLVAAKATPAELADYRTFVVALSKAVAAAHREGDADVSADEAAVIDRITTAVGASFS